MQVCVNAKDLVISMVFETETERLVFYALLCFGLLFIYKTNNDDDRIIHPFYYVFKSF